MISTVQSVLTQEMQRAVMRGELKVQQAQINKMAADIALGWEDIAVKKDTNDINQIFNDFDYTQYELPNLVKQLLMNEITKFAEANGQSKLIEELKQFIKMPSPYQLVQYLKSQDKIWKKIEEIILGTLDILGAPFVR